MATTEIVKDIQSLSMDAVIELFILDFSSIQAGGILKFHAGTNELRQNIVWQGEEYLALPIEAEGFDVSTRGTLPRPRIRVANTDGIFSAQVSESDDLVGAKVVRKRTFIKYLDAINFTDGINPTANPDQHFPDDIWFVEQKISENRFSIEWELSSALDLHGVLLPARQVVMDSCSWEYRKEGCGYAGSFYFDTLDQPVSFEAQDVCGKRLSSCKARTPGFPGGILPFGGFPGAKRYD